ncbi:hypothetical protein FPE01S_02_02080 [Flavihumibacter petaseus NBRC 106054]|uniref:TonB-dependent receptor n=2 Tax=Flavihumibacter TaxID=1004301 RepID=A0A0E9MZW0_9BACT|nr:hypothetical protein FPE01S_02_02080 [Flavihumibacter petaseus NBRC 106054]
MHPVDDGRFCVQCNKIVTDFTSLSDEELLNHFKKVKGQVCGRLRDDQLNTPLIPNVSGSSFGRRISGYFWGILLAAGLPQLVSGKPALRASEAQPFVRPAASPGDTTRIIGGQIMDDKGQGVPYSLVRITGTTLSAMADSSGRFALKIPMDKIPFCQTLEISAVGFSPCSHSLPETNAYLEIRLDAVCSNQATVSAPVYNQELCGSIGGIYISRPTFWQRVRNLFQ